MIDKQTTVRQYKNPENLKKRKNLHDLFGTNKYDWYRWVFDKFDFPEQAKILELGCGLGTLWQNNEDRMADGWDIVLSDFSEPMLDATRKNLAQVKHTFTYKVVDVLSIPYSDESFDVVVANALLYLVPDVKQALAEIARVLKPGGKLFASTSGSRYMIELEDLLKTSGLPVHHNYTQYSFSLDNGRAWLEPFFSDITLDRREDGLVVTEPRPLADRILSTNDTLAQADRQRVYDYFDEYFAAHKELRISLDTGMFIAKK